MMSAQMLNSAGTMAGTIADLAPGAKDDMRMLEAKAVEMSGTTTAPKGGGIMFVRGETQGTYSFIYTALLLTTLPMHCCRRR